MLDLREKRKQALQQLHDAAQIGDVTSLQAIFEAYKEFSINITRKGRNTILHTALFHNQDGMLLDYLIEKGADVNFVNSKGYTPLTVAIIYCKEGNAIEKLIAAGASLDVALDSGSFQGMSPLDIAEKYKNEKAMSLLKCSMNIKDDTKEIAPREIPFGKAICPICNLLVRSPTKMARILQHQSDVETNYALYGEYGNKKKKSRIYTSRKYLDEFLNHSNGEAYEKLSNVEFHAMENVSLRKEISESFAALYAVQECCTKLRGDCKVVDRESLELNNIFLIDLCSGKGITSALAAALFPSGNFFLSIDKMLAHTVPHYFFNDEQHLSYMSRDILSEKMFYELEELVHKQTMEGRTAILVGMHCCGILSERAIDLFERIPDIKGIVLSPCCLPKKHEMKTLHFMPVNVSKGENPYPEWCNYLKERIEGYYSYGGVEDVRIYQDTEMHTEKNFIVVGIRK